MKCVKKGKVSFLILRALYTVMSKLLLECIGTLVMITVMILYCMTTYHVLFLCERLKVRGVVKCSAILCC